MFSSALKQFTSNIPANYTISTAPSSIAGAWKVYDAKQKKTGKLVSVFVFERKSLEAQTNGFGARSGGSSLRRIHDEVIERLKKEASSLARLRHPNVLSLVEGIEDTRNGGLMFATEPVTASLAGLLQDKDDQERAGGSDGRASRHVVQDADGRMHRRDVEIDELEIQKGLLQVAKGLEFLHESAGLVHGNLTPEAIFINQNSDWKISGLGFTGPPDTSGSSSTPPISLSEVLYHDPRLPTSLHLNLDYTSPDFVFDSNISPSADMFSLGLLMLALYNSPHSSPLRTNQNLSTYKKIFSASSTSPSPDNNFLSSRPLPKDILSGVLPRLITRRPAQRMNAREFQQSEFFNNILVSAIRFLDSLPAKTPVEKSQFMRGLPRILQQFSNSVLDKKVLPALLEETKDRELLSLVLSNVFKIINTLPYAKRTLTEKVIPRLREVFLSSSGKANAGERDPAKEAGLVVVLENTGLIAENCNGKEFKDEILPIIQLGLESQTHSVVDKSLNCLSTILDVLDFSTIKHEVFPGVATVFSKTSSLAIKVRGLEAFVLLCGGSQASPENDLEDGLNGNTKSSKASNSHSSAVLDKYTIQEKVVPLLKAIKTKEPAVMMAALNVFKQVSKICDSEYLALDVLPLLWNFSLGPLLNLPQFQQYMGVIKTTSTKIEQEQMRKLSELSSNSTGGLDVSRPNDLMSMGTTNNQASVGEDDFERLILGQNSDGASSLANGSSRPESQRAQSSPAQPPMFSWSTPSPMPVTNMSASSTSTFNTTRPMNPDQSLGSFTALKPSPSSSTVVNSSAWNTTPLQPQQFSSSSNAWSGASQPTLSSTSNLNYLPNLPTSQPLQPSQQRAAFSISPPPASPGLPLYNAQRPTQPNTFSSFSIAPPPTRTQQSQTIGTNEQGIYGGGRLGSAPSSGMGSTTGTKQKGLDAYESLL